MDIKHNSQTQIVQLSTEVAGVFLQRNPSSLQAKTLSFTSDKLNFWSRSVFHGSIKCILNLNVTACSDILGNNVLTLFGKSFGKALSCFNMQ